jgi:antitoxin MazE
MHTRIVRWGNSLGLRIPRSVAADAGVEAGSIVDLVVEDGTLVARPVPRARPDLKTLLKGITRENMHDLIDTDEPVGKEAW